MSGKALHENQAGLYLTDSGGDASVELPKLGQGPFAREGEFSSVRYNHVNAISFTEVVKEHRTIERVKSRNIDNSPYLPLTQRLPAMCPLLISYRPGKPFAVDKFNAEQRISNGALPKDAITARAAAGTLTIVEVDPRTQRNQKHFDSRPVAPSQFPDRRGTL